MDMIIRRYGNIIDFGVDAVGPTPRPVIELLEKPLSYRYSEMLRGAAAYDPITGERRGMMTETRYMYQVINGRLTTNTGFTTVAADALRAAGYTPRLLDVTPPLTRPRAYEVHRSALDHFKWRPKQDVCVAAVVDAILQRRGGVICAPTGFGKTTIIIALGLLFPYARIHVVVRSTAIMARIMRNLIRTFPNVGQIGDGAYRFGRITLISADSLHKTDGDADILLLDEVHALMGDRYSRQLAERYMFSLNFGFSATPYDRMDGCSARVDGFCGPLVFNMNYQEAVQLGLVVPIRVHWLQTRLSYNPAAGYRDVPKKRFGIWRNDARNALYAQAVREHGPDEQVLMLVESIEHAVHLGQHLPEFTLCYGGMKETDCANYVQHGLLPADYRPISRARLLQYQEAFELGHLKKAIATDVWATGVDFEQLSVIARCDDRDSDILDAQGPGRVSRIYDGKPYGTLIDSMDHFDPDGFLRKSKGRRRSYQKFGWEDDNPVAIRQIAHEDVR